MIRIGGLSFFACSTITPELEGHRGRTEKQPPFAHLRRLKDDLPFRVSEEDGKTQCLQLFHPPGIPFHDNERGPHALQDAGDISADSPTAGNHQIILQISFREMNGFRANRVEASGRKGHRSER